jgi:hypothetical protein
LVPIDENVFALYVSVPNISNFTTVIVISI